MDPKPAVALEISEDRMEVRLDCRPSGFPLDELLQLVQQELDRYGLPAATLTEQWEEKLEDALKESEILEGFLLVEGQRSTPPVGGSIEWAGDFFSQGFVVDPETGAVDFRERKAKPVVSEGQALARIIPPIEGTDGTDVFGKRVPAKKAEWPRLKPGRNVLYDEEQLAFTAATSGRVRLQGYFLVVDEVLSLPGSVGLATGHISHPGALEVGKDIDPGSRIRAHGDVHVVGFIESADISAGGSLIVGGGINGHAAEAIHAGGEVRARYLNETRVVAEGDISIEKEIIHCSVETRGSLHMPNGRVVGGRVVAKMLIDVRETGSANGVRTELVAGWTPEEMRLIQSHMKRIHHIKSKVSEIHHALDPLMTRVDEFQGNKREMISQLMAKSYELEQQLAEEQHALDEITGGGHPTIVIRGRMFPDTLLCINGTRLLLREEVHGPLRAITGNGRVKLLRATVKGDSVI
ncbi:MAG: hypothetical protein AMXMBFR84_43790 [Candidatus Hydrogenedentota bacterium]